MEPPYDDGGEGDCGHEDVGAAIVAVDVSAPVFQAPEHVFDLMSLFICGFAVTLGGGPFAVGCMDGFPSP